MGWGMRTAFITGCDRGLGLSMAARLADHGWRVFAGSYLPEWPELGKLAAASDGRISVIEIDIGSDESVASARATVKSQVDRVDLIINNAAVSSAVKDRTIREKQDYSELMRMFNVNTLGALRVTE